MLREDQGIKGHRKNLTIISLGDQVKWEYGGISWESSLQFFDFWQFAPFITLLILRIQFSHVFARINNN